MDFWKIFNKIDQIHFINRLSFLVKSNVPVLDSIEIIKSQSKKERDRKIYREIIKNLNAGQPLSLSLKNFVDDFSYGLIYAGENGGFLGQNLFYLSKHLESKRELKRKIIGALIYPFIIALATLGIATFLVLYVFPKILPVLLSLNIDLPITTRVVIWISSFIQNFWLIGIFLAVLVCVGTFLLLKLNKKFRLHAHKIYLKIPFFGPIYKNFLLSNFCRTLGFLLNGGFPINKALELSAKTATNTFLQSKIYEIDPKIVEGKILSECFCFAPEVFPETLINMTAVAERTGNMSEIFINMSDYFEEEFNHKVKSFSQTIEPVLMIVAGFIVGFIAISIISPVYEVTQNLQRR